MLDPYMNAMFISAVEIVVLEYIDNETIIDPFDSTFYKYLYLQINSIC